MNRYLIRFTVLAMLCCLASPAAGKELVVEFKGSDNATTAEFEVKAPWIVDWRVTGDYPGQMAAAASLLSSPSGEYLGKIMTTKYVSNGVRLFDEGGRYRFQVNSSFANWALRVEQLTAEEAKAYTPKNP